MKKLLTIIFLLYSQVISAEVVNLCSQPRVTLSEKNGVGYYWDILRAVYEIEGYKIHENDAPFIRCLLSVDHKKTDGAVAVFRTQQRDNKFTYPDSRIHFSSYGVVSLRSPPIDKIHDLKGSIGLIRGYDFSSWLHSQLNIKSMRNTAHAIAMLKHNRITHIADDIQDVLSTMKKMGENPANYLIKTMSRKDLYVVFTNNERGKKLANKFDSGIKKLANNGCLERITKKYHLADSIVHDFKESHMYAPY
jgi:polar amino acid transport system substrate-binding protein